MTAIKETLIPVAVACILAEANLIKLLRRE